MWKNRKKWIRHLIPRGQRGAVSIEYIGLAAVVVAIIAALIVMAGQGGIGDALGGAMQQAIAAVSGGGGGMSVGGGDVSIEVPDVDPNQVEPPSAGSGDSAEGESPPGGNENAPVDTGGDAPRQNIFQRIERWLRDTLFGKRKIISPVADEEAASDQTDGETSSGDLLEEDGAADQSGERGTFGDLLDEAARPSPTSIDPQESVRSGRVSFSGKGEPGQTLKVFVNGREVGTVQVDEQGNWTWWGSSLQLKSGENTLTVGPSGDESLASMDVTYQRSALDVPFHSQGNLGKGYACVPTSLHMVMDYFGNQNSENKTVDQTQDLINVMKKKGRFTDGVGASAPAVEATAKDYGYDNSEFFKEGGKGRITQAIEAGHPVIAVVRVGMKTSGYAHAVAVTGISEDGSTVIINDPQKGTVEYSWETFDASWGSHNPARHGVEVAP